MKFSIQAFNAGTFWVPGPEVYWMEAWNTREEMNIVIYLLRGGGRNILINTGPPQDLEIINQAWRNFFGYPGGPDRSFRSSVTTKHPPVPGAHPG